MHIQDTNVLNPGRITRRRVVQRAAERGQAPRRRGKGRACDYKDAAFYYFSYRQRGREGSAAPVAAPGGGGGGVAQEDKRRGDERAKVEREWQNRRGQREQRARWRERRG